MQPDPNLPFDLPARLSLLTGTVCGLDGCERKLRALRNVRGVNERGQTVVSRPTNVCPRCDGMGRTANG